MLTIKPKKPTYKEVLQTLKNEYNKRNKSLGYIATPRKRQNGTLNSEYYHIVLMPKQ